MGFGCSNSAVPRMPPLLLVLFLIICCFARQGSCFSATSSPSGAMTSTSSTRFKLFKARYPLEGGPPQLRLHVAIIVQDSFDLQDSETSSTEKSSSRLILFDFLPADPTALLTTVRLLTGGGVDGNLRERDLRFLPAGAVCVGESDATLEDMRGFVRRYPSRLSLVSNSCISFVDAFVEQHLLLEDNNF